MTVQFMAVQIKTGNHGTAAPHFLAHVYWITMPLGTQVGLSSGDIVLDDTYR